MVFINLTYNYLYWLVLQNYILIHEPGLLKPDPCIIIITNNYIKVSQSCKKRAGKLNSHTYTSHEVITQLITIKTFTIKTSISICTYLITNILGAFCWTISRNISGVISTLINICWKTLILCLYAYLCMHVCITELCSILSCMDDPDFYGLLGHLCRLLQISDTNGSYFNGWVGRDPTSRLAVYWV